MRPISKLETRHSMLDSPSPSIRQEQDSDTTLDQDFVAPAPYHMPIEVVSVRVREHQHRERTPSGAVFWTAAARDEAGIVRRMKEFEGGRRPTKGCSGTKWNQGREAEINRENREES